MSVVAAWFDGEGFGGGREWMVDALCAQIGADEWFPDKGESNTVAKLTCRRCPVRSECLEYALDHDERHGIWGGLSERERRKLKTQRRRDGLPLRVVP